MLINALEFHEPPECAVVVRLPVVAAGCSPNVMFSTISAPVGQKCFIFPMDFNNSYLRPISSILDRCARIMFSMVWRTCRFGAFKHDTYFKRISTLSLYLDMWHSKNLFPQMVLATFSNFERRKLDIVIDVEIHCRWLLQKAIHGCSVVNDVRRTATALPGQSSII